MSTSPVADPTHPCSIPGEADIYGLGIRIGLYIQWYCTTLAYLYDPDKFPEISLTNYSFSIAVAVAAIVHRSEIYQHEVVLIAVLLMLPPTTVVLSAIENAVLYLQKGNPPKIYGKYGPWQLFPDIMAFLATVFLLCVATWELFLGVHVADIAPGCWPVFIHSFYLGGRYDVLLKVLAVMYTILAPLFLFARIIIRWNRVPTAPQEDMGATNRGISPNTDNSGKRGRSPDTGKDVERKDIKKPIRSLSYFAARLREPARPKLDRIVFGSVKTRAMVAMFWGLFASFTVAKIETIIKQNRIMDLMDTLQTGQLIPLVIGVIMFAVMTYEVVMHARDQKAKRVATAAIVEIEEMQKQQNEEARKREARADERGETLAEREARYERPGVDERGETLAEREARYERPGVDERGETLAEREARYERPGAYGIENIR